MKLIVLLLSLTIGSAFAADNNPGHIKHGNQWIGETKCQVKSKFECFLSPEWGTRAMARVLRNYQSDHGLGTIRQLISRWAPKSDKNDPDFYAETIANALNVNPDVWYDVEQVDQLGALMVTIIWYEGRLSPETLTSVYVGLRLENNFRPFDYNQIPVKWHEATLPNPSNPTKASRVKAKILARWTPEYWGIPSEPKPRVLIASKSTYEAGY